jgi:hypothetical protein
MSYGAAHFDKVYFLTTTQQHAHEQKKAKRSG